MTSTYLAMARAGHTREPGTLPVSEVFGPVWQGEGPHAGRVCWFVRLGLCNLHCDWCTVPGMRIALPDFTTALVEDLRVGDVVLGRTAPEGGRHGKLTPSVVTAVSRRTAPLVTVNGSLTCAADKRLWVARNSNARSGWREVTRCQGLNVSYLAEPVNRDQSEYERGYLSGVADGDGAFWTLRKGSRNYRRFRLALNDRAILDRAREYAARAGFTLRPGSHATTGFSKAPRNMECLWLTSGQQAARFEEWCAGDTGSVSWAWGYLGGIFDAEGCVTNTNGATIRIAQSPNVNSATYERIAAAATRCGFDPVREPKGIRLPTRDGGLWRFLAGATPAKERTGVAAAIGRAPNHTRVVETVEDAGTGEVVSITTTTGNYYAEGWLVHNCDTPYTWDRDRYNVDAECPPVTAEHLTRTLIDAAPSLVVLSGGEPLIHQRNPALLDTMRSVTDGCGTRWHVETNGTLTPTAPFVALVDHFTVSPKIAPQGDPQRRRIRNTALAAFADLAVSGAAIFKIVCKSPTDVAAAAAFYDQHHIPTTARWVMPEGTTPDAVLNTARAIAPTALEHALNLTLRQHSLMYGQERRR